ncbi:ABC transporter permease [Pyramidobacter sp.]|uniref:ABC transporter permease n=1 Tax=Pyramidobacter sp. TaxID=1943581 RepID=UPI0025E1F010|nr:iron ABC transporter permease [Pyramidobacter sp.]MCI7403010.1 iron ABC transporter permease [Pyramidobacter sp.]MDY3213203.1 iron ABC transporter permease [Pyramidobacter sp.]
MAPNNPAQRRGRALSGAELALWLLAGGGVLLFALWPVAAVLRESLLADGQWSFSAWRGLLGKNWPLVLNSFGVAAAVTAVTLPLASLLAVKLLYGAAAGRKLLTAVLVLSTISPPFVGSMSYLMLFGRRGLITWRLLGLEWNPYGFHGVVMMEALSQLGVATLLAAASFHQVDGSLERASLDLGASPLRTLLGVSLPLARPGLAAAALMVFVRSLSDFGTPLFVGGRFQVLASKAYNTLIGVGDFPLACAMNALLVLPSLLLLAVRREARGRNFSLRLAGTRSLRLRGPSGWLPEAAAWGFVALEAAVYGLIFAGSVTKTWGADFTLTTAHLRSLWNFSGNGFARSLACSVAAGLGGAVLGSALARLLDRAPEALRRGARVLIELPYLVPGTFFGVGYLLVSSSLPWEIPAGFLIAMNCLFRQLSPSTWSAQAGLAQINPELELAVRDLGGGQGRVLRDMLLPLLRPFMLVSFINAFSAAMTSTGPIIFLVSPYARVAAVELFESINSGKYGDASAMASLLIAAILTVNALAWKISERRG